MPVPTRTEPWFAVRCAGSAVTELMCSQLAGHPRFKASHLISSRGRYPDRGSKRKKTRKGFFSLSWSILAENVENILRQQEHGKTIASENSSKAQNIDHITTSRAGAVEFAWETYVEKTTTETLERIKL